MDALDDFADTGLHARLIAQVGNILAALSNDDTCLLGRHNCSQCQVRRGILLICLGCRLSVWTKAGFILIQLELVERIGKVTAIGRNRVLNCRHVDCKARARVGLLDQCLRLAKERG